MRRSGSFCARSDLDLLSEKATGMRTLGEGTEPTHTQVAPIAKCKSQCRIQIQAVTTASGGVTGRKRLAEQ
jgi:hypothetical protein